MILLHSTIDCGFGRLVSGRITAQPKLGRSAGPSYKAMGRGDAIDNCK